jgi:hypothetical protein
MAAYYKFSGKFAPQGPLLGILAGAGVSIPATFLYVYGTVSIPEAKLRAICTLAFGALIGVSSGFAMCWGKVRNKLVAATVGLAASLFGLYFSWFAWIMHLVQPSHWVFNLARPVMHPRSLWNAMLVVNGIGTWSSSSASTPEHGTFLWIVWIAEALLLVGTGTLAALAIVQLRPFCERCEQWCSQKTKLFFAPSLPADQFKTNLESQDVASLAKLAAGDPKQPHYRVDLHTCANCHSLNTLSLIQSFPKNHKTILNKLMIAPEQAAAIRDLGLARSPRPI